MKKTITLSDQDILEVRYSLFGLTIYTLEVNTFAIRGGFVEQVSA